jgi:hypothetical protein
MKKQFFTKTIALSILLCSAYLLTNAQAPSIQWQKCIGGSGDEFTQGIAKLSDGNYLSFGNTNSTDGDFNASQGSSDAFLVKSDAQGNIIWKKTYGGSGDDNFNSVIENDGGLIVLGTTSSNDGQVHGNHGENDVWMVRLNHNGKLLSQHCFGGSGDDWAASIFKTDNGKLVFCGGTNSNDGDVNGNHGDYDGWTVKLKQSGAIDWSKCFGGSGYDELFPNILEIENHLFFAGTTLSNDGDINGYHGNWDTYVLKLTQSGAIISSKCYGGSAEEKMAEMVQTDDGNIALAANSGSNDGDVTSNSNFSMWVPKISSTTGNIMWQAFIGDAADTATGFGIIKTCDHGFAVFGIIAAGLSNIQTAQGYVAKIDANGNTLWTTAFGGTDVDFFWKGTETQNGNLLLAGETFSNDGDVSGNHGGLDGWLVKLTNNGQRISSATENFSETELKISPNPLSNYTTISFSLSQSQNVSLNIFDMNGRLIKTLSDNVFEEGEHQIEFNAEKLNAGIYFLKMQAGEFLKTEKLIVTK